MIHDLPILCPLWCIPYTKCNPVVWLLLPFFYLLNNQISKLRKYQKKRNLRSYVINNNSMLCATQDRQALMQNQWHWHKHPSSSWSTTLRYKHKIDVPSTDTKTELPFPMSSISNTLTGHLFFNSSASSSSTASKSTT